MPFFPPWPLPPTAPWKESQTDTANSGEPDFPQSAGDRERGKFRPSATPRLTTIAVVGDDGRPVGSAASAADISQNDEIIMLLRAIAYGVAIQTNRTIEDLFDEMDSAD